MTDAAKIEVAFFDIGGVLVDLNLAPFMQKITTVIQASGVSFDEAAAHAAYRKLEIGEYTFSQYHQTTYADGNGGYLISESETRGLWLQMLNKETPAVAVLRQVRQRTPVWLLTNNNEVHIPHLESHYSFMQEVDGMVSSHTAGCRKPDAAIYELALKQADVAPHASIFIDDLEENVTAAKALGINAHHYTDAIRLTYFLMQWGLINEAD